MARSSWFNRSEKQRARDDAKYETASGRRTTPLVAFHGWTHGDLWQVLRRLVEARRVSALRQQDIAERMGVSRQFVSRLEGMFSEPVDSPAYREPSLEVVQRYAAAIGYDVRIAVLDGEGKPAPP